MRTGIIDINNVAEVHTLRHPGKRLLFVILYLVPKGFAIDSEKLFAKNEN